MKTNKYNIPQEILESALKYMTKKGFMKEGETTDNLISFTRSMVEDIDFMVIAKINQWAND